MSYYYYYYYTIYMKLRTLWRCRVSIPVPVDCEPTTLLTQVGFKPTSMWITLTTIFNNFNNIIIILLNYFEKSSEKHKEINWFYCCWRWKQCETADTRSMYISNIICIELLSLFFSYNMLIYNLYFLLINNRIYKLSK